MVIMLALTAVAPIPECQATPLPRMIDQYAAMIRRQDSAAIAHLFGPDGAIENPGAQPIKGEAAILAMLSGFKGAVVKSETLAVENILAADGGDWRVTGKFHQTGATPAGKDYDVGGTFDSTWSCTADGWRARRMATGK